MRLADFSPPTRRGRIEFARLPFDHPLYILYSSGTTGVPKCIVHGAGGTLLQHLKEHLLHSDVKPRRPAVLFHHLRLDDVELAGLGPAPRARRCCSTTARPSIRTATMLFDFAAGRAHAPSSAPRPNTSTRCAKAGLEPRATPRPDALRTIASTGSPLAPESFDYVYRRDQEGRLPVLDLRRHRHRLVLRAGQSDAARSGAARCSAAASGMQVEVCDDERQAGASGEKGELVCTAPFPSMPVGFWNDPDGAEIPRRLFRPLPRRLVPRRLCRADGARRHDHLRPLGRGAQSRRRAHRHGGDLSPGRAAARSGREHRRSARTGQGDVRVVLFVRLQRRARCWTTR